MKIQLRNEFNPESFTLSFHWSFCVLNDNDRYTRFHWKWFWTWLNHFEVLFFEFYSFCRWRDRYALVHCFKLSLELDNKNCFNGRLFDWKNNTMQSKSTTIKPSWTINWIHSTRKIRWKCTWIQWIIHLWNREQTIEWQLYSKNHFNEIILI